MDEKIRLTFYCGVNEVGGNKVLLEDFGYEVKIFLDFGVNIQKLSQYKKRSGDPSKIGDLTKNYLLPPESAGPFENLYTRFYNLREGERYDQKVKECEGKSDLPSDLDGILISHPHRDHYYGLTYINRNIPIYTGDFTKSIILAYSESSGKNFENFYHGLNWKTFRSKHDDEKGIRIKEMEIFPVHIDHSTPAAYGFIICTSAGLVVYSGDFRMHGPLNFMTTHLINKVKELSSDNKNVIALICEGTFIHKGSIESEQDVENQLNTLFENIPFEYLIVKYQRTDLDRFRTFVKIAKKFGWNYIISEKDAYFYYILNQDPNHETMRNPNILEEDHILIIKQENQNNRIFSWQKKVRRIFEQKGKNWRFKSIPDLKKLESNFFLYYTCLREPLYQNLPIYLNGAFISSDIDPYSEGHFDNTDDLKNNLRNLGLPGYRISSSGHAKPHDIINFIREINPKNILPIHTTNAKLFKDLFKNSKFNVILPKNENKPSNIYF